MAENRYFAEQEACSENKPARNAGRNPELFAVNTIRLVCVERCKARI
jgi:hypothetical protein